jgi:2-keto-3-deoxy-L-rhamnonate aldolase RhmA
MVPMLETAEEARTLVKWARYQPEGKRGLAFGVGHDAYRGRDPQAVMAAANARNTVLGLIETRKGIENCEAILAAPGFDLGWLGHFDLTADLGCTAQWEHPDFLAAVDRLAEAGKRHKKALGSLDANPEFVGKMAARGFTALGYGSDVAVLRSGFAAGLKAIRDL